MLIKSIQRVIEYLPIDQVKPAPGNPRKHTKNQTKAIAGSITEYGETNPLLIDENGELLAGHCRRDAFALLGYRTVPCIRIPGLTDEQKRAYRIADNRLALDATWDFELLNLDFEVLEQAGFQMELTGFALPEIDGLRCAAQEASIKPARPEDAYPAVPQSNAVVSKAGDLWTLGRHKLLCGDAKDPSALHSLLGSATVDLVFTDPPYNVPIQGHVSGLGKIQHREFVEASGEMTFAEYSQFLTDSCSSIASVCKDGAIVYICMDWRHLRELLAAGYSAFTELKNICVWSKTNGGMGSFYRSQHEMVTVWKAGTAPHTNTFGLGDKGRYRTNVWTYAGINSFKAGRDGELALHPTVKPVALVADAIRDCSNRGELVLDVFGGSGTTLIAAEKTGRSASLIELDPGYCDVIIKRWEKLTGKQATLASTWETFEATAERRHSAGDDHVG